MITLRKSADRGHADHGWLDSRHSFSFADYHDPAHMGFGNLRVINEDRIAPGTGFGRHAHRDMEIVSYVLEGELGHQDSLGNGVAGSGTGSDRVVRPGDVQRMSAGTGVVHSEHNHAAGQPTHFLQIWLLPAERGVAPSYAQRHFEPAELQGTLRRVVAPLSVEGAHGAISINADASIDVGRFDGADAATRALDPARLAYVHVARGRIDVNGHTLDAGDAAMFREEAELRLANGHAAEVLVFDLAP